MTDIVMSVTAMPDEPMIANAVMFVANSDRKKTIGPIDRAFASVHRFRRRAD